MEENIESEAESENEQNHTPEYVRTIYNELGMQGALDLMYKDYVPDDPESHEMTPFYVKGRAYFLVYKEILEYALNPRHAGDYDDHKYGINTYEIISFFGSWGELRTTKDDFIVYLIQCIIETMYQRGMGLPEEYAKFTFGFEQAENIKRQDIKGLIFFDFGDAFDLETSITLKRNDEFFRLFFLLRLSLIEPNQIDEFLEYQLQVSFDDDTQAFQRFTSVLLRHERKWKTPKIEGGFFYHKILQKKYIKTVEEWFNFLKTTVAPTPNDSEEKLKKKFSKQPDSIPPKIEWQGNQKQLAELFIELRNKGWIDSFAVMAIQNSFTHSDSIDQLLLKPTYDEPTKNDPVFEKVYTKNYAPKFDNIRRCIKK